MNKSLRRLIIKIFITNLRLNPHCKAELVEALMNNGTKDEQQFDKLCVTANPFLLRVTNSP